MVTAAGRAQLQRVDDPAGLLVLLKLSHPAIETAYLVADTRDWTIGGITHTGCPFAIQLPSSVSGEAPRSQITIDNVGAELSKELEKLPPNGALQASITVVSRRSPTEVQSSFAAPITGVSCTPQQMTGVIGNDDAFRAPVVRVRYDPSNSPGLFAG